MLLSIFLPGVTKWEGIPFFIIAAVMVCPLVDSLIDKHLSWLKSTARRVFLSVVIWYIGAALSIGSVVSLSNVKACTIPAGNVCGQQEVAFLETTEQISISGEFSEDGQSKQVKVTLDYWPEPKKESLVLSKIFDVPEDKKQFLLQLDGLKFKPGAYRVTLTPESFDRRQSSEISDLNFSVWTTAEDVSNHNHSKFSNNIVLGDDISKIQVCKGKDDEEYHCVRHLDELSTQIDWLSLSATTPNFVDNVGSARLDVFEITYILRYLGNKDQILPMPELVLRETSELERHIGIFSLLIEAPESGFEPGNYEVIAFLEAHGSQPVRKLFSLVDE